ncbi:hypothetical protein QZH41_008885, partial [Actinostola sp. cb2023]
MSRPSNTTADTPMVGGGESGVDMNRLLKTMAMREEESKTPYTNQLIQMKEDLDRLMKDTNTPVSAVFELIKRGITIVYCCCDGGEANRNFIKIHFEGKDPVKENFTIVNPYTREPLIFIMDFSHNIKKLRNNLSKSKASGTKNLMVGSKCIAWKQWIEAFNWDQANSLPFHHRLTTKHFQLGYSSKMRNHLAEQVLNEDMLNLMK